MMSSHDKEAIVAYAAAMRCQGARRWRYRAAGGPEDGGGLALLAARNGYVQLAKVVRMSAEWEREASLRLRAGDVSVLSEYDQHGRIRGRDAETIMEEARRWYVARVLAGKDPLLMAREPRDCARKCPGGSGTTCSTWALLSGAARWCSTRAPGRPWAT